MAVPIDRGQVVLILFGGETRVDGPGGCDGLLDGSVHLDGHVWRKLGVRSERPDGLDDFIALDWGSWKPKTICETKRSDDHRDKKASLHDERVVAGRKQRPSVRRAETGFTIIDTTELREVNVFKGNAQ